MENKEKNKQQNEAELAKLQREKEDILENYNSGIRYEKEREFDMDYYYQKTILDDEEGMAAEKSAELFEIREEEKRLFHKIQEEREDFKFQIKEKTQRRLDEIDKKISELRRASDDDK